MSLKEIYERKREAYAVWRGLMDQATKEDRSLSADETAKCNECEKAIDQCNEQIAAEEEKIRQQQKLAAVAEEMKSAPPVVMPKLGTDGANTKPDNRSLVEKLQDYSEQGLSRKEALAKIVEDGKAAPQNRLFNAQLRERAALQMNSDTAGGFLVVPEVFIARLIMDLDNAVKIRSLATVIPVGAAESIGVPTLETDIDTPEWTTELKVGDEDSSMVFGKRRLTPHPLGKWIKVSKDLLRSAALSPESIVRQRLAYKFAIAEETAFCTGSGSGEPLGLFTAGIGGNGISTDRDVSTDNTSTTLTTDGLINAKYKLAPGYLSSDNLRWIFHQDVVSHIRKLKDGNGVYIWTPGLRADTNDTILEVPVVVTQYAPNTFATTLYLGLIGDLSYYWIADSMSLQVQRLVELYAGTNQDAFIGRMALDGMPVLEEAFARVTLA